MFTVSTVLGDKASNMEQSWEAGAKLLESRPPPHWTGRGQLKEDVMFGQLKVSLLVCFRSVHGWMGMDVWVNDFTMPFLCADSGPWRKMSRAWPAMSAITTSSGSTCPSHQESAWRAAEARQERDVVQVVRKGIVAGRNCIISGSHLQMFCQYCPRREGTRRGAVLKSLCQASWSSPTSTLDRKRTSKRKHHVW